MVKCMRHLVTGAFLFCIGFMYVVFIFTLYRGLLYLNFAA